MQPKNFLIAVLLGIALAGGITLYAVRFGADAPDAAPALQAARVLPERRELVEFALLDQRETAIGSDVFVGRWDLVFFGFTNCPDICPITLQVLATAKKRLAASGQAPLPRIVLVSVDPDRDTPAQLEQYLQAFGEDNLGITGDVVEIRKLTERLGIFFQAHPGDGEYYSVDHSSVVIVIDPEGRWHSLFSSPHAVENYVHDLPILMNTWTPFEDIDS